MIRKLLALAVLFALSPACHATQINTVGDMTAVLQPYAADQPVALAIGRGFKASPVRILGNGAATYLTTAGELRDALSLYQASKPLMMAIGNDSYSVAMDVNEQVMSPDFRAGWWDKHTDATCSGCATVVLVREMIPGGPPPSGTPIVIGESTRTDGAQ